MTWPLDVFDAAYADAWEFLKQEEGGGDKKRKLREKSEEFKERARQRTGKHVGWWIDG